MSLELIDSHMNEQDVADDAVASPAVAAWVTPLRGGRTTLIHFRTSFHGRLWIPKSQVQRTRAFIGVYFVFCSHQSRMGSPSLFDLAPNVELARAGARHTDFRLSSVGVGRPAFGQALYWKTNLSTTEARFDDAFSVQTAPEPGQLESESSSRSVPPFSEYSSSIDTRIAVIIANHLRRKLTSKGPETMELGSAGMFDSCHVRGSHPTSARQRSRVMLSWLALLKAVKEQQHRECLSGMPHPDQSVRAHSGCKVAGTRIRAMLGGFVDDFSSTLAVMFWPSCGSGGFNSLECQPRHQDPTRRP